jgi:hypothetical protein
MFNRTSLAITRSILPDQEEAEYDTQNQSYSKADDHGQEPGWVTWCLVLEEKLRSDYVACAIADEDLAGCQFGVNMSGWPSKLSLTMAFAVFFFVKPPTLLLDILRTRGKLAEYARQRL